MNIDYDHDGGKSEKLRRRRNADKMTIKQIFENKNFQTHAFDGMLFSESWWRKNDIDRVDSSSSIASKFVTESQIQGKAP